MAAKRKGGAGASIAPPQREWSVALRSRPVALGRTGTTVVLAIVTTAYWLVVLPLDAHTDLGQQMALGCTTWVFLALALRHSSPDERVQVLTMIAVATYFECVGSILWGAYRYRLGNLPLYVPPGHGIFFLMAVRISALPWFALHRRLVVWGVFAGSLLLVARGLILLPALDLLGAATWLLFVAFLFRGQRPLFYAVSFTLTMALEFFGTSFGIWAWAPMLPYVGLSAANPPAGIGAGYCAMDSVAHRLAPAVGKLLGALVPLASKPLIRSALYRDQDESAQKMTR